MDPVAFHLGPLQVHWYGILIITGAVLGALVAGREAKRRGLNPEHVWNLLTIVLILGIIGARLYHVFSSPVDGRGWSYYRVHPIDIIAFWGTGADGRPVFTGLAGLGIYGGVIGGVIGLGIYTYFAKLRFLQWADIAAPGLLLAQAIGRWGNFINQELYGPPTTLPWGIPIDCSHRLTKYACTVLPPETRFHPSFLYESLWSLAGVVLLLFLGRRLKDWLLEGDVFLMYLIWYPLGRFWVELIFRPDAWTIGTMPTASLFSLGAIVLGAAGIVFNHRFRRKPVPLSVPAAPATVAKTGKANSGGGKKSGARS